MTPPPTPSRPTNPYRGKTPSAGSRAIRSSKQRITSSRRTRSGNKKGKAVGRRQTWAWTTPHTPVGRGSTSWSPSRYALRVGDIYVLVVSDGVLSLPGEMLGHNADPAVRAAWLEDKFLPPDVLEWALNVVVVRSGGRTILIDAGLGADPDLNLPRAGRLLHRLEAAGIDLASVTDWC